MNNFDLNISTRYIFGKDSRFSVASVIALYGFKSVLIVSGVSSAKRSNLLKDTEDALRKENIEYYSLSGVKPNPRADLVYEGVEICKKSNVDFILALGGGSVIDTAKAIALGAANQDDDFFDYYLKKKKVSKGLKHGCVLTIPAAGSESSLSSVIEKEVDGKIIKTGVSTPLNRPLFAILDPELTYTLPSYQTACGIVDMMCHIMERYFTNTTHVDVSDELCEGVLRAIIANAKTAIEEPDNYDARANLMWASSLAHNNLLGCDRDQDWASHHLEHQLSALYDVAHGAGLSVIFPSWMDYVYKHDLNRFCRFAKNVMKVNADSLDKELIANAGIKALRDFFKSLSMPLSFAEIGAKEEDIPLLLDMLFNDVNHKSEGNFVKLNRADCEEIYKIAASYKEFA